MFKLPAIEEYSESTEMFKMEDNLLDIPFLPKPSKLALNVEDLWKDEGYSSPNKESVWEVAMHLKLSARLTWESYQCGPPDKEKPFLSELGELSSLWVENLPSLYKTNSLCPSYTVVNSKIKPRKDFVKDLKFLLGKCSCFMCLCENVKIILICSFLVQQNCFFCCFFQL